MAERVVTSSWYRALLVLLLATSAGILIHRVFLDESTRISVTLSPAKMRLRGEAGPARTEFRVVTPLPVIDVRINGSGPFPFVVDTGAACTLVAAHLADELLVRADTTLSLGDGESPLWYVERLDIGSATFEHFGVASDDSTDGGLLTMEELSDRIGHDVKGILGFSIFGSCQVVLDFPSGELRVRGARESDRQVRRVLAFEDPSRPIVQVFVKTDPVTPLRLLIDTGFSGSLQLGGLRNLPLETSHQHAHGNRTFVGYEKVRGARLAAPIVIAGHRLERVVAQILDEKIPLGEDRDGLIGMGLLRGCALSFDASEGLVEITW